MGEPERRLCVRIQSFCTLNRPRSDCSFPRFTLYDWRREGGGPPFVRMGNRGVGYLESDLAAWLETRRRTNSRNQEPDESA